MWTYDGREVTDGDLMGYVAFVYVVTRTDTGKKYIGKKRLKFKRTKVVKGKRKKVMIDSDWRTYWGSNKQLLAEIEELGEGLFSKEIVRLCRTLGESNYYEAKMQFESDALIRDDYYNEWVIVKVHRSHVKR